MSDVGSGGTGKNAVKKIAVTVNYDKKASKYSSKTMETVQKALIDEKQWTIKMDDKGKKVASIGWPQVANGHTDGTNKWKYQIDTDTMGKGSKDRLFCEMKKADYDAKTGTVTLMIDATVGLETH